MDLNVNVRGSGEAVLMVHGIISDASFFDGAADVLKDKYKVIAYDRRGYGKNEDSADAELRSAAEDTLQQFTVAAQAEDAANVIKMYSDGSAWVFGNSAGGLISIELALKFPELVKGLILLEPSLVYDDESVRLIEEWNRELNGYVESRKIKRALPAFSRVIGGEASAEKMTLEQMKQTYKNLTNFMYGELNEVQHYRPDIETVRGIKCPVKIFVTADGQDSIFAKTSVAGAKTVGWDIIEVPGRHNMAKEKAAEFAKALDETIEGMSL